MLRIIEIPVKQLIYTKPKKEDNLIEKAIINLNDYNNYVFNHYPSIL